MAVDNIARAIASKALSQGGSGGSGTSNYEDLTNKPKINNVEIVGNTTGEDLGLVSKVDGKALSTNDFTDEDKLNLDNNTTKLNGIENGAEVNVKSNWNENDETSDTFILNKPTKLSDFINDKNFIDSTVDNLVNYYTKTNIYNKDEINTLIGNIKTITIQVVEELPTTDISTNVIYFVPKNPTQEDNLYDEYINLDGTSNSWEKIGDTKVDLSDYYTKEQANALLSNKVDVVIGKGLSTNDFTNEDKEQIQINTNDVDKKEDILIKSASGTDFTISDTKEGTMLLNDWTKNLLPNNAVSKTVNGITFTVNADGTIATNGISTNNAILKLNEEYASAVGKYILSGCPTPTFQYKYMLRNPQTGNAVVVKEYSSDTSYTFAVAGSGTQELYVYVKDENGNEIQSEITYIIFRDDSSLNCALSLSSNLNKLGDDIQLFADACGGSGNYLYKFDVMNIETGNKVTLQDYSSSATFTTKITTSSAKKWILSCKDTESNTVVTSEYITTVMNDYDSIKACEKINGKVGYILVDNGQITASASFVGGIEALRVLSSTGDVVSAGDVGNGAEFTEENSETRQVDLVIYKGFKVNNLIFKPQIEVGTVAHPYVPNKGYVISTQNSDETETSEINVTNDMVSPLALKSFEGSTNVISPSNVNVSYAVSDNGVTILSMANQIQSLIDRVSVLENNQ